MNKILIGCLAVLFAFSVALVQPAKAQTDASALMATIESLLAQIASLQEQLNAARGELDEALKDGLVEGMEDEDIREIQELLATNPAIYPQGITSGYFGSLTRQALERFQAQHGLPVTGEIDDETKEYLEEYLKEKRNFRGANNTLWQVDMKNKIRERVLEKRKEHVDRMKERCEAGEIMNGQRCERLDKHYDKIEEKREKIDDRASKIESVDQRFAFNTLKSASKAVMVAGEVFEAFEDDDEFDEDDLEDAEEDLEKAEEHLEDAKEYYREGNYRQARFEAAKARLDANRVTRELRKLDKNLFEDEEEEAEEEFDEDELEDELEEDDEDEDEDEDEEEDEDEHDDIIGMTEAEAEAYADDEGVQFRVGYRDGEDLAVTMDYIPGRITASVEDGVIVSYTVE